ncbi:ribonuclease P protein component [Paracoccus indicus]|uniref:ribonuclease P protein component n=1 Tax=Paracoccus indicus TaxID=2079229 RepID=UPI000D3AE4BA
MPPLPHPADTQPTDAGGAAFRVADGFKMPPVIGKRADFLAAAKARRQAMPGFLLQARRRDDDGPARIGFTCSKKVGNAVARNRAKRRLREIARLTMPQTAQSGWDYVLVGRPGATASLDFTQLCEDFARAMRKVHK